MFGCHENSDPGKQIKKKHSSQSYHLKCFIVMQCSEAATARKDQDIYLFRFTCIPVMSCGYKNWLQFEQHYSDSVSNFYFFGEKICRQMSSNLILTPLNECQSWWAWTIRRMRPWHHNLCAHVYWSLEIFFAYTVLSHGSIMLLPHQPRVFARLVLIAIKHLKTNIKNYTILHLKKNSN